MRLFGHQNGEGDLVTWCRQKLLCNSASYVVIFFFSLSLCFG